MLFWVIYWCVPAIVPQPYVSVPDMMWHQSSALYCNLESPCKHHFSTSSVDQILWSLLLMWNRALTNDKESRQTFRYNAARVHKNSCLMSSSISGFIDSRTSLHASIPRIKFLSVSRDLVATCINFLHISTWNGRQERHRGSICVADQDTDITWWCHFSHPRRISWSCIYWSLLFFCMFFCWYFVKRGYE